MAMKRTWLTIEQKWTAFFYWLGAVLALACVALEFAHNASWVAQSERMGRPVLWFAGAGAILAFAVAEICNSAYSRKPKTAGPVLGQSEEEALREAAWETETVA